MRKIGTATITITGPHEYDIRIWDMPGGFPSGADPVLAEGFSTIKEAERYLKKELPEWKLHKPRGLDSRWKKEF